MSKIFILGAGFSKAVSSQMPILSELSQQALAADNLPVKLKYVEALQDDIEQLLSYLYQEMPWETSSEAHFGRGLFSYLTERITEVINQAEEKAFAQEPPQWAEEFVRYLHRNKVTVITLNYDTIVETLATIITHETSPGHWRAIPTANFYRLPIAPILSRTLTLHSTETVETFRLLKPHGSVNWYLAGEDIFSGHQVFSKPVRNLKADNGWKYEEEARINQSDLVPLIIPPVAEKSVFYRTRIVRLMWSEFRKAIENATEIYCIGYSLPKTDLTMRLFLRAHTYNSGKIVHLVNRAQGIEELKQNYEQVFTGCSVNADYVDDLNAISMMVENLIKSEEQSEN